MRYDLNSAEKLDPVEFNERSKSLSDAHRQAADLHKQQIHLISADEKSGIQALERGAPTLPLRQGQVERQEYNDKRHGVLCLTAHLEAATGKIIAPTIGPTRGEPFVQFLFGIDAMPNLKALAEAQPKSAWKPLVRPPTGDLLSNWAYRVMATLAWTLKAWWGLMLPEAQGRGHPHALRQQQKRDGVRMEFKRFVASIASIASIVRLPCQILRSGRRLIYRLLNYRPWQEPLLAAVAAWRTRTPC